MKLIASTAFGIESCVSFELKKLGAQEVEARNGRIDFKGDFETIAKANMHLRCAERVFINMGEFKALTFEDLFQGTKAIEWEKLLPEDACFPVSGKSVKSVLHSVPDCQAIVKKAIVERLKGVYKKEWFEETPLKNPVLSLDHNLEQIYPQFYNIEYDLKILATKPATAEKKEFSGYNDYREKYGKSDVLAIDIAVSSNTSKNVF